MGVLAHVQRAVRSLATPIVADRLRDGEDMRLRERAVAGRTAVAAGSKADSLAAIGQLGNALQVLPFKPGDVDQKLLRGRLSCEWGDRHGLVLSTQSPGHESVLSRAI